MLLKRALQLVGNISNLSRLFSLRHQKVTNLKFYVDRCRCVGLREFPVEFAGDVVQQ